MKNTLLILDKNARRYAELLDQAFLADATITPCADAAATSKRGIWDQTQTGTLRGKTIGIMGVGSIGPHLARTAKHFEMRTTGFTFSRRNCDNIDEYFHQDQLPEFVAQLDYLVITLPDTIITSHTAAPTFPEDILPIFLENYQRFCTGPPLKYQIDFNKGY